VVAISVWIMPEGPGFAEMKSVTNTAAQISHITGREQIIWRTSRWVTIDQALELTLDGKSSTNRAAITAESGGSHRPFGTLSFIYLRPQAAHLP
jgi:hypothetical protein